MAKQDSMGTDQSQSPMTNRIRHQGRLVLLVMDPGEDIMSLHFMIRLRYLRIFLAMLIRLHEVNSLYDMGSGNKITWEFTIANIVSTIGPSSHHDPFGAMFNSPFFSASFGSSGMYYVAQKRKL